MSSRRELIIDIIKRSVIALKDKNVPIFGVPDKNLKRFTTTEKDMKAKRSNFHIDDEFRLFKEDLLTDDMVRASEKSSTLQRGASEGTDDYEASLAAVNVDRMAKAELAEDDDEQDDGFDDMDNIIK